MFALDAGFAIPQRLVTKVIMHHVHFWIEPAFIEAEPLFHLTLEKQADRFVEFC